MHHGGYPRQVTSVYVCTVGILRWVFQEIVYPGECVEGHTGYEVGVRCRTSRFVS